MRIAIIGAGFSGIALAWHLLRFPNVNVEVFDPTGVGGGASGIAAGLLHTYAGLHAKFNPKGLEGYRATRELLDIASKASGRPVYAASGLLRVALNDSNFRDYSKCAQQYAPDVEMWSPEQCRAKISLLPNQSGLFIPSALSVDCEAYLRGLWQACESQGAKHSMHGVSKVSELSEYDVVVVCTGAEALQVLSGYNLPLTAVKGQILELEWPAGITPLPMPLNTQAYVIMQPDNKSCIVGSTYERQFNSATPDQAVAIRDIMPKVAALYPPLTEAKVIGCKAGVRASTPDHMPLMRKLDERTWVLSGMGSKGLLYHALYAKELAEAITRP